MDLETLGVDRTRFMAALERDHASLSSSAAFIAYWDAISAQLPRIEEPGMIERWLRQARHDLERLEPLARRLTDDASAQPECEAMAVRAQALVHHLQAVARRLSRRLSRLRDRLGSWIWLAGPGASGAPPPPQGDDDEVDEGQEDALREALHSHRKAPTKKGTKG